MEGLFRQSLHGSRVAIVSGEMDARGDFVARDRRSLLQRSQFVFSRMPTPSIRTLYIAFNVDAGCGHHITGPRCDPGLHMNI